MALQNRARSPQDQRSVPWWIRRRPSRWSHSSRNQGTLRGSKPVGGRILAYGNGDPIFLNGLLHNGADNNDVLLYIWNRTRKTSPERWPGVRGRRANALAASSTCRICRKSCAGFHACLTCQFALSFFPRPILETSSSIFPRRRYDPHVRPRFSLYWFHLLCRIANTRLLVMCLSIIYSGVTQM